MLVDLLQQRPELFEDLLQVYFADEEPFSRRAAWVIDLYSELHPYRMHPHVEELTSRLPAFSHDALKRHGLRMLIRLPLPDQSLGTLVTCCFDWMVSRKEAVAVKTFSMEILYRVSLTEPGIRTELADTISWRLEEETPAFQCRGKKILKKLSCGV
jgi:hypothetical protein